MGENRLYLNFEIRCEPFAVLHVQLLKLAAASFILSSFFYIDGDTSSYLGSSELFKSGVHPGYLYTSRELSLELLTIALNRNSRVRERPFH